MEVRGLCPELVLRDPRSVGDLQMEAATWVRRPSGPVLRAEGAAAGTDRDGWPSIGPVDCHADFSIVDEHGNAVSLTYTLNSWFGARLVAAGTGIVMNNEMDDFTSKPGVPNQFGLVQGAANAVAPGKTPLSSMSPTIVTKDGHVAMVIGSPGGSRIITITLEAISNMIDYGMTVQEAIDAPRVHMQWLPDTIYLEPYALSPDTRKMLEAEGYKFTDGAPWGIAEGIVAGAPRLTAPPGASSAGSLDLGTLKLPGATLFGAHDPRGPAGLAAGE